MTLSNINSQTQIVENSKAEIENSNSNNKLQSVFNRTGHGIEFAASNWAIVDQLETIDRRHYNS